MADGSIIIDTEINEHGMTEGINNIQDRLSSLGDSLKGTGETMSAALTVPLAGIGVAALAMADDFYGSIEKIQNSLGVTSKEAEKLAGAAKDIYEKGFGESLEETTDALIKTKKNIKDLNDAELGKVTQSAMVLAETFDADINEVTRAGSGIMENFGLDSEKAFDLMASGAQNGLNFSDELFDNIAEYAPLFKQAGFSADEWFQLLEKGSKAGVYNLDYVNDAIKEFGIRIADGSKGTAETFAQMSKSTQKLWKDFNAGKATGKELHNAVIADLKGMDNQVLANQLGVGLYGTKFEDLGLEAMLALGDIGKGLTDTSGKMDKMNATAEGNRRITAAFRQLQGTLTELGMMIATAIVPVIEAFTDKIKQLADWFYNLSPSIQNTVLIIAGIAAAIGPVLVVIGTLITALSGLSLPIVAIVAGIGLLIAAFATAWQNSEQFRTIVTNVFETIKSVVLTALSFVADFIREKLGVIKQFWSENGDQIIEAVTNAFNIIKSVIDFVMPAVLAVIKFVWESIKGVINGALNIIMGAIKIFSGLMTGDFGKMWEGVKQLFSGAVEFIWNLINLSFAGRIISIIKAFGKSALGFFKNLLQSSGDIFRNLDTTIWNIISKLVSKVVNSISNFVSSVKSNFDSMRAFGGRIFESLWQAVRTTVSNMTSGVVNAFQGLVTGVKFRVQGIYDTVKGVFGNIKHAITNPIETAKNLVLKIVDKIKGAFNNLRLKIPKFPLPHVSVSTGHKKVGPVNIPYPKVNVEWYKTGGVFTRPVQAGNAGFGDVNEAIVPFEGPHAKRIASLIAKEMPSNDSQSFPSNMVASINIGGYEMKGFVEFLTSQQVQATARGVRQIKGRIT